MTAPPPARLREAHAHIAAHGRAMTMERFETCRSVEEFLERVARAITPSLRPSAPPSLPSAWLLGGGIRTESWREPRWPTLAELDAAAGDRPLCAWSFDHHALVVNTAAMRALGLRGDEPDPPNGRIVRDGRGRATGLMLEGAAKLVWSRVPEPTAAERLADVERALADLASHGFVEVHDLLSPPWLGPLLRGLEAEGRLPVRVWLYPALADLDAALAAEDRGRRPESRVTLAGAKLFADGTLNSRTAWMLPPAPYVEPLAGLPCGQPMVTRGELVGAMERVWGVGLGLAVHAIGDGAVRAVLDAFEGCRMSDVGCRMGGMDRTSDTPHPPALRVEHAEVIDGADVGRFARLGVVASVQPCHLLADIEVLRRQLPSRIGRVLPLRELIDSGCRPGELLWFGSDTPIVRPDPGDSIRASVHRRREGMVAAGALAGAQAITEAEAWGAFQSPL